MPKVSTRLRCPRSITVQAVLDQAHAVRLASGESANDRTSPARRFDQRELQGQADAAVRCRGSAGHRLPVPGQGASTRIAPHIERTGSRSRPTGTTRTDDGSTRLLVADRRRPPRLARRRESRECTSRLATPRTCATATSHDHRGRHSEAAAVRQRWSVDARNHAEDVDVNFRDLFGTRLESDYEHGLRGAEERP